MWKPGSCDIGVTLETKSAEDPYWRPGLLISLSFPGHIKMNRHFVHKPALLMATPNSYPRGAEKQQSFFPLAILSNETLSIDQLSNIPLSLYRCIYLQRRFSTPYLLSTYLPSIMNRESDGSIGEYQYARLGKLNLNSVIRKNPSLFSV